jgi:hypothetical protein
MAERKTAAIPATSKQSGKQAAPLRDPQTLTINGKLGETVPQSKARAATKASLNASMVVNAFQGNIMGKDVDISELVTTMQTKFKEVNGGDLSTLEAMLVGQATALQTMFTSLAMRATNQEYLKQYGLYMTLALKAQAQSRATISALVDLKYPKQAATFVKQANISSGHQQVNNQSTPELYAQAHAHAEDFQTTPNKLLETNHGQRLDIGAQAQTGRTNQRVEAVGAIHRA